MNGLMLHAGSGKVDREVLQTVITPEPTHSWQPIPHHRLLEGVQGSLERAGLRVVEERHGLSKDGGNYFGTLQLRNGTDDKDFGLMVGIRNSHTKKFPVGLVVGAKVFVCDNLSFSGEIKLARKHTVHVNRDLTQLIDRAVGRLSDLRHHQDVRFGAYRGHGITDANAHDILIQALDAQVFPVTRLPQVLKEYREPRHEEFRHDHSIWRLFNSITEIEKAGNIQTLPARTQALHGLLDAFCGLANSPV